MNIDKQGFSIIMTAYNQADELKENLPAYLSQTYEPGYEVIVVDETSSDDTPDVLKLYKQDYPILYTTFLPKPDILCARKNENELQAIVEALDEEAELTFGYISKKGIRLQSFASYDDARYHILKGERKLKHIYNRMSMSFLWGRYNFIVIRKDISYDVLKYFGQKVSASSLLSYRIHILLKNIFGRSETTFIKF